MRQVFVEDRPIDAGPTVFTMRWVFDELLDGVGRTLEGLIDLQKATILARHGWPDGSRLDLPADRKEAVVSIAEFAGQREARGFQEFMAEATALYDHTGLPFMRSTRTDLATVARRTGVRGALALLKSRPYTTMWGALSKYFQDPRLRQLFGRYATYYGSSPFMCPPNLMLVTHVEQEGVWFIRGGMHQLARRLAELIVSLGGTIVYGASVNNLIHEKRGGLRIFTKGGADHRGDAAILNVDLASINIGGLGDEARKGAGANTGADRSLSAMTFSTVAIPSGFPLLGHTVLFSDRYEEEFDAIFKRGEVPSEPTVYISAQDRGSNDSDAPDDRERLFLLINAPANGDLKPYTEGDIKTCERDMRASLARCGLTLEQASSQRVATTPNDFEALFPGTGGALYGQASNSWGAFFARPTARTRVPGLYLAGGSVHPGAGVPTVALSGLNAAGCVTEDLALTSR